MLHDKASGLSNVWLADGYSVHETKWGKGISVEDADGLSDAIAIELCVSRHRLDGEAVRFLRRHVGMTQEELGAELGCTDQAVAKWEKGDTSTVPVASARLLRLLVLKRLAPETSVGQALPQYDEEKPEVMVYSYSKECGWRCSNHEHLEVKATYKKAKVIDFIEAMNIFGIAGHFDSAVLSRFAGNDREFERHASKLSAA